MREEKMGWGTKRARLITALGRTGWMPRTSLPWALVFAPLASVLGLGCGHADGEPPGTAGSKNDSGGAAVGSPFTGGRTSGDAGGSGANGGRDGADDVDLGSCEYDPSLEKAVRSYLDAAYGQSAANVTELQVAAPLDSLRGIECLTSLTRLGLYASEDVAPARVDLTPLGEVPSLEVLSLTRVEAEHAEVLGQLKLRILEIQSSALTSFEFLAHLPSLEQLVLDSVQFDDLAPLAELPKLERLSLSELAVTSLEPLAGHPALQTLDLQGLELSDLSGLREQPALSELKLNFTKLDSFAGLSDLPKLESVVLLNADGPSSLDGLEGAPHLKNFVDNESSLSDIGALAALHELESFSAGGAALSGLDAVRECPSLVTLAVWGNQLKSVEPLAGHPSLKNLDITRNQLEEIEALEGLALEYLSLGQNQIADLSPLAGMPLVALDISNNPIASLEPIASLTRLGHFTMSSIGVNSLAPLRHVPLVYLGASHNSISDIEPISLHTFDSFDLANNDIRDIPEDFVGVSFCFNVGDFRSNPLTDAASRALQERCDPEAKGPYYVWDGGSCEQCLVP